MDTIVEGIQNFPRFNRFSLLDEVKDVTELTIKKDLLPPPIFIPGVSYPKTFYRLLTDAVCDPKLIRFKSYSNSEIKVQLTTTHTYRGIVHFLNRKTFMYYTYQLKTERTYLVVIRGIHPSTPVDYIKKNVNKVGFEV